MHFRWHFSNVIFSSSHSLTVGHTVNTNCNIRTKMYDNRNIAIVCVASIRDMRLVFCVMLVISNSWNNWCHGIIFWRQTSTVLFQAHIGTRQHEFLCRFWGCVGMSCSAESRVVQWTHWTSQFKFSFEFCSAKQ